MTDNSTDPHLSADAPETITPKSGAGSLWTDLGPVIIFVLTYNIMRRFPEGGGLLSKENAVYWATGVFMAAILGVIGWTLSQGKRPSLMLIITGVIVTLFGGLTLLLKDPVFIYYKPTIINLLFAGLIFGGLLVGKNVWKLVFEHAFDLPDHAWKVFAIRWGLFYIALAGLNEFIWRSFSEDFWTNSKIFLVMPLTFVFMMANIPYLMKHSRTPIGGEAKDKP